MEQTLKFKTNIKCLGCVAQVTSALDDAVGSANWEVDLMSPEKWLTVTSETVDADIVVAAVQEVGFKAEAVQ
ncbi:MAG: heavy-metal-associated domain-containing protein [Thermoanaerobaculia bacterium]|nr:heavy-metal-associated domain-containing protein [Thermoanaerobaculia bacterium]